MACVEKPGHIPQIDDHQYAKEEPMLDFAAISAFVTVGDSGGFRSAADILGMTSSGVSKAIARLEKRVGVQLLARSTRSVRLTPAGAAFHSKCKTILAELSDAEHDAAGASVVPSGRLTVSMSATGFGRNRVLPIIAEFVKQHPQVEVQARLSDRFVDLVEEGVDLAVRIGKLPDSGLIATKIGETGFVLCGTPGYLAAAGVPSHPDDLVNHRFVGFVTPGTASRFEYRFAVNGQIRTMQFASQLTVDDGEALVTAAMSSVGLILIVDYLVDDLLQSGRLVRLLRDFETLPWPVNIVHVPSRHPSPAARLLIDMLKRGMKSVTNNGKVRPVP
jgi:LysR family transcriptional regulator for bpeEF and oprC